MVDIGAGKGHRALLMSRMGRKVSSVGLSQSGVETLRARAGELGCEVDARVADITALPFMDGAFDCAVCFHTICHTDYQGVQKALEEIRRVLKPNGEVYLAFNAKESPTEHRGCAYTVYKQGGLEDGIPHTYLDMGDIETLMRAFVIIRAQRIEVLIYDGKRAHGIHCFVYAKNAHQNRDDRRRGGANFISFILTAFL